MKEIMFLKFFSISFLSLFYLDCKLQLNYLKRFKMFQWKSKQDFDCKISELKI